MKYASDFDIMQALKLRNIEATHTFDSFRGRYMLETVNLLEVGTASVMG